MFHQRFVVSNVSSCYFSRKIEFHMFFICFIYVSAFICYYHLCSSYVFSMFQHSFVIFIYVPHMLILCFFTDLLWSSIVYTSSRFHHSFVVCNYITHIYWSISMIFIYFFSSNSIFNMYCCIHVGYAYTDSTPNFYVFMLKHRSEICCLEILC
jgi:hypothetical protein